MISLLDQMNLGFITEQKVTLMVARLLEISAQGSGLKYGDQESSRLSLLLFT